jgi:ribonuclease Z
MFMRGVSDARGDGKTILGKDGLLISLPKGTKDIETKQLY